VSGRGGPRAAPGSSSRSRALRAALALALLGAARGAGAASTFVVNSIADVPKAAGPGAVCETAPGNGVCTLRAAVMAANRVPGGHATIRVPAGLYVLSIPGTPQSGDDGTGDLDLLQGVTIVGEGPSATVLDGNYLTPLFWIAHSSATGDNRIEGLTIRHGSSSASGGGLAEVEPDVDPPSTTLENVAVTGNQAAVDGGGLYQSASHVTLRHCIVLDNTAEVDGAGLYLDHAQATISDSLIEGNSAGDDGGGGYSFYASTTIERTSVLSNAASSYGGGLSGEGGQITVVNSTFDSNSAGAYGGGIFAEAAATLALLSDTFSVNRANSGNATAPPASLSYGGGVSTDPSVSATLRNTVLSDNTSGQYLGTTFNPDEAGPEALVSLDYNACGTPTCVLTGILTHVTQSFPYPLLDTLASNGGFSLDRLPAGMPLIRSIPPASCLDPLGGPLADDGRGLARVGSCDIGALQQGAGYAAASLFGTELIRNGGAAGNELGEADTHGGAAVFPPYWVPLGGNMTQVVYGSPGGGFPLRADAPAGSGAYLFAGGPGTDDASVYQLIDLSDAAAAIDDGTVSFRLSGAFGGTGAENDHASLQLRFLDAAVAKIADVTIGGFTAADRGGVTKLLPDFARGVVPPGTRSVAVTLTATITDGSYNDGYADDLSLRVPEPEGRAGAWAVAALAAMASSRRRRAARRRERRDSARAAAAASDALPGSGSARFQTRMRST
jgi:predicted outer membrane repeat protein